MLSCVTKMFLKCFHFFCSSASSFNALFEFSSQTDQEAISLLELIKSLYYTGLEFRVSYFVAHFSVLALLKYLLKKIVWSHVSIQFNTYLLKSKVFSSLTFLMLCLHFRCKILALNFSEVDRILVGILHILRFYL